MQTIKNQHDEDDSRDRLPRGAQTSFSTIEHGSKNVNILH